MPRNPQKDIGRALMDGVMGTLPDDFAKHLQQHRLGVPLETRHDCPACNRQRVYDDSEARREQLDYRRSSRT